MPDEPISTSYMREGFEAARRNWPDDREALRAAEERLGSVRMTMGDMIATVEARDRELAAAYDALRDLFHATAGHIGCRTCKHAMVRHAETLTKTKTGAPPAPPDARDPGTRLRDVR